MELCMSLIKDALPFESELHCIEDLPTIRHFMFLREGQQLDPGYAYLARAEDVPKDLSCIDGASLICIGQPSDMSLCKKIPLLIVSAGIDVFELANELVLIFSRYNSLEEQLNTKLQEGKGLQEMVECISPFFMNELTIADAGHRILAHAPFSHNSHEELGFKTIGGKEMVPVDIIAFFTNNKRWIDVATETEPFIYDEGILPFRLLCINIMEEGRFAWRVMLNETDRMFRPYDVYLLQFFTTYIQKIYDRSGVGRDAENVDRLKDILHVWLSGGQVEAWRIQHALLVAGHPEDSRFVCLCVRPESWDDSAESLDYYCLNITKTFPGVVAVDFKDDIVCLAGLSHYGESVEKLAESVVPYLRDSNFRVGISEVFDNPLKLRNHYLQADIALSYGSEKEPSRWVHRFHEEAVSYMLSYVAEHIGVETLCAECVQRLHAYDSEHDASYIRTMKAYFDNHLNISKTAQVLNIHRATMIYRLRRIEELSGIDFQNASKNFYYLISIKLLDLMDI